MKINEILVDDQIIESFNSAVEYEKLPVEQHKEYSIHRFILKTKPVLDVSIRLTDFGDKTIGDVVFFQHGESNFKALNVFGTKGALSIFNTIMKLCETFIDNVDIWNFSAKFSESASAKEFEKRTNLYDRISLMMSRKHGLKLTSMTINGDKVYILSKEVINKQTIVDYLEHCSAVD